MVLIFVYNSFAFQALVVMNGRPQGRQGRYCAMTVTSQAAEYYEYPKR